MRLVCSAAVLLGLTGPVRAQPSPDLTREFQAGVDAFRLGKLDDARAHLEKAAALDPKLPGPNRFLAAVAQAQGRWQDCIDAARLAIELAPRSGEIADTRKVHDECRRQAGRTSYRGDLGDEAAIAVVTNVPGATVKIGGLTYGGTPLAPRPITAGPLEIDVDKAGWKPAHITVNALGGIVTDVSLDLEPDPAGLGNPELGVQVHGRSAGGVLVLPVGIAGQIAIDGAVVAPREGTIEVTPGPHIVEIRRPGTDPWRRRIRVSTGQKLVLAPRFVDTATRERKERLGMMLVGGGAAIAVFGFAATLIASHASDDAREIQRVETARPPGTLDPSIEKLRTRAEFEDARSSARTWSVISDVAFGAALGAVGAGAVYMYLGGKERSDVPPPFALTAVTGGAMVSEVLSW